jgi:hypothetical protein
MFHALNAFIAVWGLTGTIVGYSNRLGDFVEKVTGDKPYKQIVTSLRYSRGDSNI